MPDDFPRDIRDLQDPTALTTQALLREVAVLEEKITARLDGLEKVFTARLLALERSTEKFEASLVRVPTEVQKAVENLAQLHSEKFRAVDQQFRDLERLRDEKFHAVTTQFLERDIRSEQGSRDAKVAVEAALASAKEAVAEQNRSSDTAISKSEHAVTRSIEQQGHQIASGLQSVKDQIDDIKQRIVLIEGRDIGASGQRANQHNTSAFIISLIGVVLAGLAFAVGLFLKGVK